MNRRRERSGYVMVAAAAALWGSWTLLLRPAERLGPVSPAFEAFVIFASLVVVVGPSAFRDRRGQRRSRRAWAALGLLGVGDALNALCFFSALQATSVAVAVLTHCMAPVLIALAAPKVLGESVRARTWFALAAALAGIVLIVEPWEVGAQWAVGGAMLGMASAVFYAANVLLTKRLQGAFSPREILAWHSIPAAAITGLFVPRGGFSVGLTPFALVLAAGLCIGVTGGLLFVIGLVRTEASRAAVLTLLEPAVAVTIGALVWHEIPGTLGMAGATLVFASAYAVLRA